MPLRLSYPEGRVLSELFLFHITVAGKQQLAIYKLMQGNIILERAGLNRIKLQVVENSLFILIR